MATNMVPSASIQAKKTALMAMQSEWRTVRDPKTGQRVIVMPNLTGTRVYYVHPRGKACSCKAGQNGLLCGHRLAAIEAANQEALTTWVEDMVKPRKSYADLVPACRSCNDIAEDGDLCSRCGAEQENRQRMARRGELIAGGRPRKDLLSVKE